MPPHSACGRLPFRPPLIASGLPKRPQVFPKLILRDLDDDLTDVLLTVLVLKRLVHILEREHLVHDGLQLHRGDQPVQLLEPSPNSVSDTSDFHKANECAY